MQFTRDYTLTVKMTHRQHVMKLKDKNPQFWNMISIGKIKNE